MSVTVLVATAMFALIPAQTDDASSDAPDELSAAQPDGAATDDAATDDAATDDVDGSAVRDDSANDEVPETSPAVDDEQPAKRKRRKRKRKKQDDAAAAAEAKRAAQVERKAKYDVAGTAFAASSKTAELDNATWRFEVGGSFEHLAASSSIGVNTQLLPLGGVHFGMQREFFVPRLVLGGGARLLYGQQSTGNGTVRVGALYLAATGRGIVGYDVGTRRFGFMPYAFCDVTLGGGPGATKVEAAVTYRFLPLAAAHIGGGMDFRFWNLVLGIDVGAGAMNLRASLMSLLRFGVTF